METKYTKLKDLVNSNFMVQAVPKYSFKKWDDEEKKMLVSDIYEEGYRKLYQVETDKGTLDLGSGQLGNLLEAVFYHGKADLIGRTFNVKSNGKEGKDIRYYFNAQKSVSVPDVIIPANTSTEELDHIIKGEPDYDL